MSRETSQVIEAANVGVSNTTSDMVQVREIAEVTKSTKEALSYV